jgi:hypothetical protein
MILPVLFIGALIWLIARSERPAATASLLVRAAGAGLATGVLLLELAWLPAVSLYYFNHDVVALRLVAAAAATAFGLFLGAAPAEGASGNRRLVASVLLPLGTLPFLLPVAAVLARWMSPRPYAPDLTDLIGAMGVAMSAVASAPAACVAGLLWRQSRGPGLSAPEIRKAFLSAGPGLLVVGGFVLLLGFPFVHTYLDMSARRSAQASHHGSVEAAAAALKTGSEEERIKAVHELAGYGRKGLPALLDALATTDDAALKRDILRPEMYRDALYRAANDVIVGQWFFREDSARALIAAMSRARPDRRLELEQLLFLLRDTERGRAEIVSLAEKGPSADARMNAITELGRPWGGSYDGELKGFLTDDEECVRAAAAYSLSVHRDPSGLPAAVAILKSASFPLSQTNATTEARLHGVAVSYAVRTVALVGSPDDIPLLQKDMQAPSRGESRGRPARDATLAIQAILRRSGTAGAAPKRPTGGILTRLLPPPPSSRART